MFHTKVSEELAIGTKYKVLRNHKYCPRWDVYRLHYVRFGAPELISPEHVSWGYQAFRLPKGMERAEFFRVLSYMIDQVADKSELRLGSHACMSILDRCLDRIGVRRSRAKKKVVSLFIVEGNEDKFRTSDFYLKYFKWYVPNVSHDEVKEIFARSQQTNSAA